MSVMIVNHSSVSGKDAAYVDSGVVEDTRLSNKAILTYTYIVGHDEGIDCKDIASSLGTSLRTVYRAITELTKYGYLYNQDNVFYVGSTKQSAYELYLEMGKNNND